MATNSYITEAKIERYIRGVEAAGKTVVRVIIDGSRIELVTLEDNDEPMGLNLDWSAK